MHKTSRQPNVLHRLGGLVTLIVLMVLTGVQQASAQGEPDQIILVPYSQSNTALPHPAHEGANITLKGIIRNATCAAGYDVVWDVDRNGQYDDFSFRASRDNASLTVRDMGRTFSVPAVPQDTSYNINVRVTNTCSGVEKFATWRMFVYDFVPSSDPTNWTEEQVGIMGQMSIQELLWFLHRHLNSLTGRDTAQIRGEFSGCGGNCFHTGSLNMWMMTVNGYSGAYPPGTINTFNRPLPNGWVEDNEARWNTSPYAEDIVRIANGVTRKSFTRAVPAVDEADTCGYNPDLSVRHCNRIPGTSDTNGIIIMSPYAHRDVYTQGLWLGSLSTMLSALGGTPVQLAEDGIEGISWENYIQQAADSLGHMQIDSGNAKGSFYYHSLDDGDGWAADASTAQWGFIGMESAEVGGSAFGVVVPNRIKYRMADAMITNQQAGGGGSYRNLFTKASFQLTGGDILAARYVGVHLWEGNNDANFMNAQPFPNESTYTRQQMLTAYERYLAYTATAWTRDSDSGSIGWQDRLFLDGDYLCGNRNAVYFQDGMRCGNSYAMYSHQKAYRTGSPELTQIGGRDWAREFSIYSMRAQMRNLDINDPRDGITNFGQIRDDFCETHSVTCAYANGFISAAMQGLIQTPSIFSPNPVAIGEVAPAIVTEGCAGGNNGDVVFDHSNSFHPSPTARIVAWQWDVNDDNGLWWENGQNPDFSTGGGAGQPAPNFAYTYQVAGNYTATLRVVDNLGQISTTTVVVQVNVSANVPPGAAHGGPYLVEVGSPLRLQGIATDGNLGCGREVLTVSWDLDNDGAFDDANAASANVAWATIQNLAPGQAHRIRLRVRDDSGEEVIIETTLTIVEPNPVANATVNPNPAACNQQVNFDGSGSFTPNPNRSIQSHAWDFDGDGQADSAGAQVAHTYNQFGQYTATLTVTDDLGRQDQTQVVVDVDQGNGAPIARTSQPDYVVLEGDALTLDGRGSSDPDVQCGDSIVSYRWDVNGNGNFGDAIDAAGANPQVPWNDLRNALGWPQNAQNGAIVVNARLQVTDGFGEQGIRDFTITLFAGRPVAQLQQVPNPSPINLRTGSSTTTLNALGSFSPINGVAVVRFDWDLDGDGVFEVVDQPVIDFVRVFDPLPQPDAIPRVTIVLRVYDEDGRVSNDLSYDVLYDIPPTAPTADADPTDPPERGYHILVGESVRLDGSQSFDPDAEEFGDVLVAYRWDLIYDEDDGFVVDYQTSAQNAAADPRILLPWGDLNNAGINGAGEYAVALEVEDSQGLVNQDTSVIHVYPMAPNAVAIVDPNPAACNGQVTFDARGSNHPHPDVDIVEYRWDLDGDGEYDDANENQPVLRFDQFTFNNPIQIGLEVEDTNGNVGRVQVALDVTGGNRAPQAEAGGYRNGNGDVVGPYVIALGESLQIDGAGSIDPDGACGDSIISYQWDIGNDGGFDEQDIRPGALSAAALAALGINQVGNYEVRLRVTDRLGLTTDDIAVLQVVNGPTAFAEANPNRAGCNQQVEFDGRRSSTDGPVDQGFAIVDYAWDFDNDGQYDDGNQAVVNRPVAALPDENGLITVNAGLQITDASGRTSTTEIEVVIDVQNLPPVAVAGGPYVTGRLQGGDFADVRLDGRASHDPNAPCDAIAVYKWDTDNDGLYGADDPGGDLVGAQVAYNNPNWQVNTVQTVRLQVCDLAGVCSAPSEAEIRIRRRAPPVGVVVSPRADNPNLCLGANAFTIELNIGHPEGERVTATARIGGVVVGSVTTDTHANGDLVAVEIQVDPAGIPEGQQLLIVELSAGQDSEATIDAGGRITFDRTAPVVNIGAQPAAGVCFDPNQVPEPQVAVNDNLDPNPLVEEGVIEDACGRTLRVTATDTCGNVGTAQRAYLVAVPAEVNINGVQDGELVEDARLSWQVVGPAGCASNITASLARNGGAEQPYPENALVNQPGDYVLRLIVANCAGVALDNRISFAVNRPPVAIPVTAGHVQRDLNAPVGNPFQGFGYTVNEGDVLRVDASDSQTPERAELDQIARFDWDFNNDNGFDAEGEQVVYPTDDDGVFIARLQVTDSIGAIHSQLFQVSIADVDPVADAGDNLDVDQGAVFSPDGSGSHAGSPADAITEYIWDWGDGTPVSRGPNLDRPEHTYADNGVYNLRLTVVDEDSQHTVVVVVTVSDVDPNINGIDVPEDLTELNPMHFVAQVEAGAPNDPITRYEWDFDGDGVADYAGVGLDEVDHVFLEPGPHTVTLTVRDGDSAAVFQLPVVARELTLAEIISYMDVEVTDRENANGLNGDQQLALLGYHPKTDIGLWGEANDRRGNTLLAVDAILVRMIEAHAEANHNPEGFGRQLWAMSRQLVREMTRMEDRVVGDVDGLNPSADSLARAHVYVQKIEEALGGDAAGQAQFRLALEAGGGAAAVQLLHHNATEAYYWLSEAVSPCNLIDLSYNPELLVDQQIAEANVKNVALTGVLVDISAEMHGYINAPGGPGQPQVQTSVEKLDGGNDEGILPWQRQPMGMVLNEGLCEDVNCITDRQALSLELEAMELANQLNEAALEGVWVRNWQSCVVNTVKFRIEASIARLETACGVFDQIAMEARARQATGELMVEGPGCALDVTQAGQLRRSQAAENECVNAQSNDNCQFRDADGVDVDGVCIDDQGVLICDPRICSDADALDYYKSADQRCFLIRAYNECLVIADPTNLVYDPPQECLQ